MVSGGLKLASVQLGERDWVRKQRNKSGLRIIFRKTFWIWLLACETDWKQINQKSTKFFRNDIARWTMRFISLSIFRNNRLQNFYQSCEWKIVSNWSLNGHFPDLSMRLRILFLAISLFPPVKCLFVPCSFFFYLSFSKIYLIDF